jgi:hypothetical protein
MLALLLPSTVHRLKKNLAYPGLTIHSKKESKKLVVKFFASSMVQRS